jgi:tetratricopeptide (TPR) repeat protein
VLEFTDLQPGLVPVGDAYRLVIVPGDGRHPAQVAIRRAVARQAAEAGTFEVEERLGRRGERPKAGEVALQINVTGWAPEPESWPNGTGPRINLEVTVTTATGGARTVSIEGRAPAPEKGAELGQAVRAAIENAAAAMLEAITPRRVTRRLQLDDSDGSQDPILKAATEGRIARAHEDLRRYLERHPENAAAAYNLALLTEALGRYEDAIQYYDRALELDDEPLYRRARRACAEALGRAGNALQAPRG